MKKPKPINNVNTVYLEETHSQMSCFTIYGEHVLYSSMCQAFLLKKSSPFNHPNELCFGFLDFKIPVSIILCIHPCIVQLLLALCKEMIANTHNKA